MNKGKIQRTMGFPGGSVANNKPANAGDMGPIVLCIFPLFIASTYFLTVNIVIWSLLNRTYYHHHNSTKVFMVSFYLQCIISPYPSIAYLTCCSVTKSLWALCDPMDYSTHNFPVCHYLPEFSQTHVHGLVMPSSHLVLCCSLSSCPQFFPASGPLPMSQLFISGEQSIGTPASASVLTMNIQGEESDSSLLYWEPIEGARQRWFPEGFAFKAHSSEDTQAVTNCPCVPIQARWWQCCQRKVPHLPQRCSR